jgi:hypothetical protein
MADAHVAHLLAHLARHRRRLVLLAFARHLLAIGAAALVAVAVALFVARPPRETGFLAVAAVALASTAVAGVVTFLRRPSTTTTARLIDRRLDLHDRTAAALEHCRSDESIVSLIVADATRRLAGVRPNTVFPFELWPRAAITAVALAAAVAASSIDASRSAGRERGDGSQGPSAGAAPNASARDEAKPGSADVAASDTSVPASAPSNTRSDGTRSPASRAEGSSTSPSGETPERRHTPPAPETGSASATTRAPTQAVGRGSDASSNQAPAGGVGADAATGARGIAALSGAARPGAERAGGSAAGGTTARTGAGGVTGGALVHREDAMPSTRETARVLTAARFGHVRAQAESALSRDDIPPALRRYVRDYFLALQPPAKP